MTTVEMVPATNASPHERDKAHAASHPVNGIRMKNHTIANGDIVVFNPKKVPRVMVRTQNRPFTFPVFKSKSTSKNEGRVERPGIVRMVPTSG